MTSTSAPPFSTITAAVCHSEFEYLIKPNKPFVGECPNRIGLHSHLNQLHFRAHLCKASQLTFAYPFMPQRWSGACRPFFSLASTSAWPSAIRISATLARLESSSAMAARISSSDGSEKSS